jgi:acyl carrier protein
MNAPSISTFRTSLRTGLRAFLRDLGVDAAIGDEDDLFGTGALKSMQLIDLVNHLEDHYAVRVGQRDITGGRLRNVAALEQLVLERGRTP